MSMLGDTSPHMKLLLFRDLRNKLLFLFLIEQKQNTCRHCFFRATRSWCVE